VQPLDCPPSILGAHVVKDGVQQQRLKGLDVLQAGESVGVRHGSIAAPDAPKLDHLPGPVVGRRCGHPFNLGASVSASLSDTPSDRGGVGSNDTLCPGAEHRATFGQSSGMLQFWTISGARVVLQILRIDTGHPRP